MIISGKNISIGYNSQSPLLSDTNFEIPTGKLICLLGPNGSGKSTLLKSIAGIHPIPKGELLFGNISMDHINRKEIAKILSLCINEIVINNIDVFSLISAGRHPYTGLLGKLTKSDIEIVEAAIQTTDCTNLRQRYVNQLSDGERQKVFIARALAQETPHLLFDEPTAFLDLPAKMEIINMLKKLTIEHHKSVLLSTHDLEIALQMADIIWIIYNKKIITGTPIELYNQGLLQKVFSSQYFSFEEVSKKIRILISPK